MKFLTPLVLAATALAAVIPQQAPLVPSIVQNAQTTKWLIELAPYQTRWVTEEEKWALKLVSRILNATFLYTRLTIALQDGVNFIDVTDEFQSGSYGALHTKRVVHYPGSMHHEEDVVPLTDDLSKSNMKKNLKHFTSFHTRYYKSQTGIDSAEWLYDQVSNVVEDSGASEHGATVEKFDHPWGQFSIIARIPGQTNNTVVLGAHQDSINLFLPSILAAPGADDDGSGTVTILESLRALLRSEAIAKGEAENTIEFHWYSAEEGGLLGSQAVYAKYKKDMREVKAMLQQDMTGFVQGTLDAGLEESVGVIVDYVDQGLTNFIKEVITTVSSAVLD